MRNTAAVKRARTPEDRMVTRELLKGSVKTGNIDLVGKILA
jgi:hypothetical protein